ncbi:MAG: HipA N-terminal domain-containing protein [Eubacterium ventriosum]
MKTGEIINVFYNERPVGTLAITANHMAAFEYCDSWIDTGFSISPFSLPLGKKVYVPQESYICRFVWSVCRYVFLMRGGDCFWNVC